MTNQNEELIGTLKWYENLLKDCNRHGPEGNQARDTLAKDCGQKARAAIDNENRSNHG